ncbi:hypothetical protein GGR57DRAFT_455915 [Xylariaceae sp. FL1272]|nr:hypothetical protein GGR57DRAFT_455915 [Xylariaceae sp. FL1272]
MGFGGYGDPNDFGFRLNTPPGRLDSPSYTGFGNDNLTSIGGSNGMTDHMYGNINNSGFGMYGSYEDLVGQELALSTVDNNGFPTVPSQPAMAPRSVPSAEAHQGDAQHATAQTIVPANNQGVGSVASGHRINEGSGHAGGANVPGLSRATDAASAPGAAIASGASAVLVPSAPPVAPVAQVAPVIPGVVVVAPDGVVSRDAPGDPDGSDHSGNSDDDDRSEASYDSDEDQYSDGSDSLWVPISVDFPEEGRPDVFDAGVIKSIVEKCREYKSLGQAQFNSPQNIFMYHQIFMAQKMYSDGYYKGPFLLNRGIIARINEETGNLNMGDATLRPFQDGVSWYKISPVTKQATGELLGTFVDHYPEYLDLVDFLQEGLEPDYTVVEDYINQVAPNDVFERALEKCSRMQIPFPEMPEPVYWAFHDESDEDEDDESDGEHDQEGDQDDEPEDK